MPKSLVRQSNFITRSQFFNIDNGAGTTADEPVLYLDRAARVNKIYAIYGEATQTVAAGNFKVGFTAGGADLCAATAYENSKAVGVATAATLVTDVIPAGTTIFVRHTGVAVTQTGTASIVIELAFDE